MLGELSDRDCSRQEGVDQEISQETNYWETMVRAEILHEVAPGTPIQLFIFLTR